MQRPRVTRGGSDDGERSSLRNLQTSWEQLQLPETDVYTVCTIPAMIYDFTFALAEHDIISQCREKHFH